MTFILTGGSIILVISLTWTDYCPGLGVVWSRDDLQLPQDCSYSLRYFKPQDSWYFSFRRNLIVNSWIIYWCLPDSLLICLHLYKLKGFIDVKLPFPSYYITSFYHLISLFSTSLNLIILSTNFSWFFFSVNPYTWFHQSYFTFLPPLQYKHSFYNLIFSLMYISVNNNLCHICPYSALLPPPPF